MTIWMIKRRKSGLRSYDMANELNIPYDKYQQIERGHVKMPNNLIDKFNEIINRGKHINKMNGYSKDEEINKWFNEVSTYNEADKDFNIRKLMNEYNIPNYKVLSKLLNVSPSYVSNILNKHSSATTMPMKSRLYEFFHNELNIQPIDCVTNNTSQCKDKTLKDWWDNFDLPEFLCKNKITQREFGNKIGLENSTISALCIGKTKYPYLNNLKKIKKFVENYEKDDMKELKEQMPELPTEEINTTIPCESTVIVKPSTIIKNLYDVTEQVKNDDSVVSIIKTKLDSYLNSLETLEYEIANLNEQLNERKKEMELLTNKKDALLDVLNDLESGE